MGSVLIYNSLLASPVIFFSRHAVDYIDAAAIPHVGLQLDKKIAVIPNARFRESGLRPKR